MKDPFTDRCIPVLMVIAAELRRSPTGTVVLGLDTQAACDRAADLASDNSTAMIVITAGDAPEKWDCLWMAHLMEEYLIGVRYISRDRILIAKATEFNTYAETFMLARLIAKHEQDWISRNYNALHVYLIGKWWHMPRVLFLCNKHLRKRGIARLVVVSTICLRSYAS